MRSTSNAAGVVLSDVSIEGSAEIGEEIIFKVASATGEIGLVFLSKIGDFVE